MGLLVSWNDLNLCKRDQFTAFCYDRYIFFIFYVNLLASYGSLNYLQGATTNIIVGSQVWVEDPSVAWIDGEVLNIKGEEAEIQTTDGKKVSRYSVLSN